MCTVWRSRIFMIGAAILAIIVYLNTSITVAVTWYGTFPVCQELAMFEKTAMTLAKIDVFVNCLIPSVTMVAMVALMCVRLGASYRREQTLVHNRPVQQRTSSSWTDSREGTDLHEDNPPPFFIIAYVSVFLLLSLPKQVIYAYLIFKNFGSSTLKKTLKEYLVQGILEGFPHVKSLACFVVLIVLHTALRRVVGSRLSGCGVATKRLLCGETGSMEAETYPLRGHGSPRRTNVTGSHTPTSTSFLCEIEVREVNT